MREIRLYGKLAKFIGKRVFRADVASPAEAVRFLVANFPQVEAHMADQYYKVGLGERDLEAEELHHPAGQQVIKIIPVMAGAGDVGKILLGAALIGLAFVTFGGTAFAGLGTAGAWGSSLLFGVGASLVLGGVSGLLTPTPVTPTDTNDPRKSYSFSSIQNSSRQGTPVPVIYGETIVGSVVVSAGIDIAQVAA
jgi:predicted phage tail protein